MFRRHLALAGAPAGNLFIELTNWRDPPPAGGPRTHNTPRPAFGEPTSGRPLFPGRTGSCCVTPSPTPHSAPLHHPKPLVLRVHACRFGHHTRSRPRTERV